MTEPGTGLTVFWTFLHLILTESHKVSALISPIL